MKRNLVGMIASLSLLSGAAALAGDVDSASQRTTQTTTHSTATIKTDRSDGDADKMASDKMKDSQLKDDSTVGDSKDTSGAMGAAPIAARELQGELVKMEGKMLWVKHMGALVPLKIDKNTRFDDKKDLKEGQDVRASFTVKGKTTNLATSVSLQAGTGGSGSVQGTVIPEDSRLDDSLHRPAMPERTPAPALPEDPGTAPKSPSSGTTY